MTGVDIRRGDVYFADLTSTVGSEQGGYRPVLVIQNDIGNRFSPTTICIALTSRIHKARLPTHVEIPAKIYPVEKDTVVLCEQIRTLDKSRLKGYVTTLSDDLMRRVDRAIQVSILPEIDVA